MIIRKKRGLSGLIAVVICFVMIVGCSNENKETVQNAGSTTNVNDEAIDTADGPYIFKKPEAPVTVTAAREVGSAVKFKEGEDIDNNVHTEWMKNEFGIALKHIITAPNGADLMTKIRLALAGNQEWPDVFFTTDMQLAAEAIEAGKVMSIDEAIQKYASPKLLKLYTDYPQAFAPVTKDGKRYGLPTFLEGSAEGASVMFIREDWLKKLNLQAPKTIEELEKVMDAFANQDPDGNGTKDTFGLAINLKSGFGSGLAGADGIIGAFTASLPHTWVKGEDGKLVYGSVQPEMKSVLGKFKEWMDKGYLNPEAGVGRGWEDFVEEKAGIVFGPMWLPVWPLPDMVAKNPQAEYKPYPLPTGIDNRKGFRADTMPFGMTLFKKDFEHMDLIMAYLDKIYDYWIGDESSGMTYGLHEGYDYVEYNGKVYYKDLEANGVPKEKWPQPNGQLLEMPKYISFFGGMSSIPPGAFEKPAAKFTDNPEAEIAGPIDVEVKYRWPQLTLEAYMIYMNDKKYQIANMFSGAPTRTMLSKGDLLSKMETDAAIKIIYSKEPLDYFDTFVENWLNSGGEKMMQEVNDWYDSVK